MTAEPLQKGDVVFVQDMKRRKCGVAKVYSPPALGRPALLRALTPIHAWFGSGEFSTAKVVYDKGSMFFENVYALERGRDVEPLGVSDKTLDELGDANPPKYHGNAQIPQPKDAPPEPPTFEGW